MSYIVIVTSKKPADVKWFIQHDPETHVRIREWQHSFPGLAELYIEELDSITSRAIMEFVDEAAYDLYNIECKKNIDWSARNDYNTAIGLTIETVVSNI